MTAEERATAARGQKKPMDTLTRRERQLVRRFCGCPSSGAELAREFGITQNTLRRHFCNIYDKLGVGSRAELIARWRELHPEKAQCARLEFLEKENKDLRAMVAEQALQLSRLQRGSQPQG